MDTMGFLHNKIDVKILILFILSRFETPLTLEDLHEVAYQDDSLNYFTLIESLEELTRSGHILKNAVGRYSITEKGRTQEGFVEDSMAVPVVRKVTVAIDEKKAQFQRESLLQTEVTQDQNGKWIATLRYQDGDMPMMSLSLLAPNEAVGKAMAKNMKRNISTLYKTSMDCATDADNNKGGPQ